VAPLGGDVGVGEAGDQVSHVSSFGGGCAVSTVPRSGGR
jgi:hypothetical protein